MHKQVHDKRPFYDRRVEPLIDPEWDEAESANEIPRYYWVELYGGGKIVKEYKSSVAELVSKRTGVKVWPV